MLWPLDNNSSAALENLKVVRGVLILEGRIEPGDFIRVRNFLSDESNFKKMSGQIFLASQGGNVFEALQIGYLIRHLRLSTDAPSRPPPTVRSSGSEVIYPSDLANPRNYQCTSACFLLYVAGVHRDFIWTGRLGLHHPQLEHKPIGWNEKDVAIATDDMRNKIKDYLDEMNVPNKYLDLMYSTPPSEVRWISQSEFNADLTGYIPELRELLGSKCHPRLRGELSTDAHRCDTQTKTALRIEAWRKVFHNN